MSADTSNDSEEREAQANLAKPEAPEEEEGFQTRLLSGRLRFCAYGGIVCGFASASFLVTSWTFAAVLFAIIAAVFWVVYALRG